MNIFVTDPDPIQSARNLPDKHIVKMPLETCQMLSIIYSDWYYGVGQLHKLDGTPYRTAHGAFRKHPCTIWAAAHYGNLSWLITHGLALCDEYKARYNKTHSCYAPMLEAVSIFEAAFDFNIDIYKDTVDTFTRAMPEHLKYDDTISTITAYQRYLNTKPWLATNYLRIPSRKPSFIITPMTQSTNEINPLTNEPIGTYFDKSDWKGEPILSDDPVIKQKAMDQASEDAAIAKSLQDAKAAMESKKPAPAVKAVKAKGLVPAKKAAKTSPAKKAGRIVGISAAENAYIQEVLQMIADDSKLGSSNANYVKILARYNK